MKTKKAAPKTAHCTRQVRAYRNPGLTSTENLLTQAGEALCLVALFPLTAPERIAFWLLLEHRLRRAYGESANRALVQSLNKFAGPLVRGTGR